MHPRPHRDRAAALPASSGMLRVAVLDDHPAVLGGLERLIRQTPGMETLIVAPTAEELFGEIGARRVDLVVLDYRLSKSDGLSVCQRLKERAMAPRVVLYTAYAGLRMALAARVAGA